MRTMMITTALLTFFAQTQALAQTPPGVILHAPPARATIGAVELRFEVPNPDAVDTIVVRYRVGDRQDEARAVMTARGVIATLALEGAAPGVVHYWVVELREDGSERAIFASEASPYPMALGRSRVDQREVDALALTDGRRHRISALGVYEDLGTPTEEREDRSRYGRADIAYSYGFHRLLDRVEVGIGVFRGQAGTAQFATGSVPVELNYGRAALTLSLGSWIRVRSGGYFGIDGEGFAGGVEGSLFLGHRDGTEVEASWRYLPVLGASGGVRLGLATVPRWPMSFRVEVTTFPDDARLGLRLLYDLGYEFSPGSIVRVTGGYRGDRSSRGGPSLAVELAFAFGRGAAVEAEAD